MSAGNSSTKRRPALLQQQQFYAQMRLGDRGGQLSLLLHARRATINNDDNYACMGFIVSSALLPMVKTAIDAHLSARIIICALYCFYGGLRKCSSRFE
jgi:hypothetical protein